MDSEKIEALREKMAKCTECGASISETKARKWGRQCSVTCHFAAIKRQPIPERLQTRVPPALEERADTAGDDDQPCVS